MSVGAGGIGERCRREVDKGVKVASHSQDVCHEALRLYSASAQASWQPDIMFSSKLGFQYFLLGKGLGFRSK